MRQGTVNTNDVNLFTSRTENNLNGEETYFLSDALHVIT